MLNRIQMLAVLSLFLSFSAEAQRHKSARAAEAAGAGVIAGAPTEQGKADPKLEFLSGTYRPDRTHCDDSWLRDESTVRLRLDVIDVPQKMTVLDIFAGKQSGRYYTAGKIIGGNGCPMYPSCDGLTETNWGAMVKDQQLAIAGTSPTANGGTYAAITIFTPAADGGVHIDRRVYFQADKEQGANLQFRVSCQLVRIQN